MGIRGKKLEALTVEKVAAEGKCIAKHGDLVVFIDKVVPGDVVDVKITKKKKNYLEATPVKFHQLSSERTEPFCGHFGTCGGCKWQHLPYDKQLEFKQQQVYDDFRRIGKLEFGHIQPIIASEKTRHYRNKLEYTFTNRRWLTRKEIEAAQEINRDGLGFHVPGSFDRVLDIDTCYLQPDPSDQIRNWVKNIAREHNLGFYDILKHSGFLRNLIIRNTLSGDFMVILQVAEHKQEEISIILDGLKENFSQIKSLYYVVNQKKNETIYDQELILYAGEPFLTEKMDQISFQIGPKSFFQTNSHQAYQLYKKVEELASLTGKETVYDLYTGTGTIANFLAAKAGKVVGIEVVPEAIDDARKNAEMNGHVNIRFLAGSSEYLFDKKLIEKNGKPDILITDPPRAGMHPKVLDQILAVQPPVIIYISCNPATQARDLAILCSDYQIDYIQPVDMFPHTHHVENIVKLIRK